MSLIDEIKNIFNKNNENNTHKINALNSSIADVSNNLQTTVNDIEEKDWGNRIRKTINQQ